MVPQVIEDRIRDVFVEYLRTFPCAISFLPSLPVDEELDLVRVPNLLIDHLFNLERSRTVLY